MNKKQNKYTFCDHSDGDKVILKCFAKDILEADAVYREHTGKNPIKQTHVGCSVEFG